MPDPIALLQRVTRQYGGGPDATDAVRDVSCVISGRERIALVGPSGSGKSTLLHLIGGLDEPTTGTISWPALGSRTELRPGLVADVFQGPSLLPSLTVLENVRFPLILNGADSHSATEAAERALATFGVDHLRDKLPEEISGGQAQRAAIARAIAIRPALILADEPTGQLDSMTALEVLVRLLDAVQEIGAAIVISTHDLRVAGQLDTVWSMQDGHLATAPQEPSTFVPSEMGAERWRAVH